MHLFNQGSYTCALRSLQLQFGADAASASLQLSGPALDFKSCVATDLQALTRLHSPLGSFIFPHRHPRNHSLQIGMGARVWQWMVLWVGVMVAASYAHSLRTCDEHDGQLKGLGFCSVEERRDLMTSTEQTSVPAMAAFIIGGTGRVGRKLVAELAQSEHFTRVVTLGRRVVAYDGPGKEKLEQHVVDFDKMDEQQALLENLDIGFNTMGTTIADAGSPEQFTKIDLDIPIHVARLFKQANPSKPLRFCNLSSVGASATSSMLYPKTKGLLEQHLTELGFSKLSVFRPGLLVYEGDKGEKLKLGESIACLVHKPVNFLTGGRAAVGIPSAAKAMRIVAEKGIAGGQVDFYDNRGIRNLANPK